MKRQGLVAAAVLVAVVIAVILVLRRGSEPKQAANGSGNATVLEGRVFVDDSLGVRLRIPDSPGWTLRRDPPGQFDGRVVTAAHQDGQATLRLIALPATAETQLETVLAARQKEMAPAFAVDDLNKAIARVVNDETRAIGSNVFKQWQAVTHPVRVPGEPANEVAFLWLMTVNDKRSLEALGVVRYPAERNAEQQAATDALLKDVIYILQSLEVR